MSNYVKYRRNYMTYYTKHRDEVVERVIARRKRLKDDPNWESKLAEENEKKRLRYARTKAEAFIKLGGKCSACNNPDFRVLQIDHIHNDGATDRRIRRAIVALYRNIILHGAQDKYQLLCANCHMLKHNAHLPQPDLSEPLILNRWRTIKPRQNRPNKLLGGKPILPDQVD